MSWDRIKMSRRVIIHIPSLGLNQEIRDSIHDFGIRQNRCPDYVISEVSQAVISYNFSL